MLIVNLIYAAAYVAEAKENEPRVWEGPAVKKLHVGLRSSLLAGAVVGCATAETVSSAHATQLSVSGPFLQWYNEGPNDLSFGSGEFIWLGADSVVPNGFNGTSGTASTTNLSTGGQITSTLSPITSVVSPNLFNELFPLCTSNCSATASNNPANLLGPWTLTFTNPSTTNSHVSDTLSLAGTGEIPFVSSIAISGTSQYPTFSWSAPPSVSVDGYTINIYQNNLEKFNSSGVPINSGEVTFASVGPNVASYTVSPSDFTYGVALQQNTLYTIEINAIQTRNGSTTNLSDNNVSASSSVYASFETLPMGTSPVNLPTVTRVGNQVLYTFNLTVAGGVTYAIDPEVATGYIYQTGAGNPNFASVSLPNIGNSNPYSLYVWNGSSFVFDTTLAANTVFDFAAGGVSEFEVLGIDTTLGLDPNNPTAFITDLTFEGAGNFTGTMTPITTSIPEPSTWAMIGLGFAGLALAGYRGRKSAAIAA
jgi:hypothetical protein